MAPYDFGLSTSAVRSFEPGSAEPDGRLRFAARVGGKAVVIEVEQGGSRPYFLVGRVSPAAHEEAVRALLSWVFFTDLALTPFYRLVGGDSRIASVVRELHGLKPMRPNSLFEMAVVAITEQQVSLASAWHVRHRLIEHFGEPIQDLWVFPEPAALAASSIEELRSVGLSRQKADYIHWLAQRVVSGEIDMDALKSMDGEEAKATVMSWRGFGAWSADYILVRGLARPDSVPVDDLGIRDVVGRYLGSGVRVSSSGTAALLEPFRPYRGLVAFYLLVHWRLQRVRAR